MTIERVALDLFAERGYDAVTVAEIAEGAGISLRTFFRYFPTKDAIVRASDTQMRQRLLHLLRAAPEDLTPLEAFRTALIASSAVRKEDRPAVLKRWRVMASTPLLRTGSISDMADPNGALVTEIARRMGAPANDPRPQVMVAAMLHVAGQAFLTWAEGGGEGEPEDWTARYLDVLADTFPARRRR
ncbi:MAG: TetR family transcriptional regulator [Acidobacteria bacterium]|nr:TetR family transcriptional regulator [Acidobacteriota bacterium]